MDVVALVPRGLVYFHLDAMRVGPGVLADTGDLPGNLHARFAGLDSETSVGDFRCDDGLSKLANHGELIAKICVESLEPRGHGDDGCAAAIGDDVAVVDVHHVGRFDEGMIKILIRRVERMIDLKRAAGFTENACDVHVAREIAGVAPVALHGVYSSAPFHRSRATNCPDAVASNVGAPTPSHDTGAAGASAVVGAASSRYYANSPVVSLGRAVA